MPHSQRTPLFVRPNQKTSLVYIYLIAGITLLVAVFLFAPAANAQTGIQEDGVQVDSSFIDEELSEDVLVDEQVTVEDLGAEETTVLPDSPLHAFKRIGRGFRELITFDPVEKSELRLKHANQELHEARLLIDKRGNDPDAAQAAGRAIARFERKVEAIENKAEAFKERHAQGDQAVERLLDDVLDKQLKQQKILAHIEDRLEEGVPPRVAERVLERIHNAKEKSAGAVGEVLSHVEDNPDRLADRFDRVLHAQDGSHFQDLRHLEILKRIEDNVDGAFEGAFDRVEHRAFERFVDRVDDLPEDIRRDRFEKYVHHVGGDETRHLELIDRLKSFDGVPEDLLAEAEQAKDIFARRFQHRVEGFEERFADDAARERARARAFARFEAVGQDVDKLRVIEDLRQRVEFDDQALQQEIDRHHEESIDQFKAAFTDDTSADQAQRFRALSAKMAENPDPTTFRLLQELEQEVLADPTKRAFVERMEREAKAKFVERAQQEQEKFFEQIASSNPEDIEIFKQLQREFAEHPEHFAPPFGDDVGPPRRGPDGFGPPPGFEFNRFFEQAIDVQADHLGDHLANIEDADAFGQFQDRFEHLPPAVLEEIKRRDRGFDRLFNEKRDFANEIRFGEEADRVRHQLEEERRAKLEEFGRLQKSAGSPEEQEGVERERLEFLKDLRQKEFEARRRAFEQHSGLDPFCDERCQEEERAHFELQLRDEWEQAEEIQKLEDFNIRAEQFIRREEHKVINDVLDEFDGERFDGERLPPPPELIDRLEELNGPQDFGPEFRPPFPGEHEPFGHDGDIPEPPPFHPDERPPFDEPVFDHQEPFFDNAPHDPPPAPHEEERFERRPEVKFEERERIRHQQERVEHQPPADIHVDRFEERRRFDAREFHKPEPREFDRPEPTQIERRDDRAFDRPEPQQFNKQQFDRPQPSFDGGGPGNHGPGPGGPGPGGPGGPPSQ